MHNNDQEFLVQKIRSQYTEKEHTELDSLTALDRKVRRPANVFGYIYGSVSAVIMGAGMSLVMTDIGSVIGIEDGVIPGIAIGLAGLILVLTTFPIHQRILSSRKKKFAPEILKLSDQLIQKN